MKKPEFKHKAVYGDTGSGKTWLVSRRAREYARLSQRGLIWTCADRTVWPRGFKITDDPDEFEEWLQDPANFGSFVFVDEASDLYEDITKKTHPQIYALCRRGRHKGYTAWLMTQYPTSIPRRNRVNCGQCYCFRLGDEEAAQLVWKDYARPDFEGRPLWELILELPTCEGFILTRGSREVQKFTLK